MQKAYLKVTSNIEYVQFPGGVIRTNLNLLFVVVSLLEDGIF